MIQNIPPLVQPMPPASASKPAPARKRQRKRKRRVASSSESSSSSDSDSDSSGTDNPAVRKVRLQAKKPQQTKPESSSSSSSSSSDDSSDSDTSHRQTRKSPALEATQGRNEPTPRRARRSLSPDVPLEPIPPPSFLPETGDSDEDKRKEDELKGKFRKLWMSSIADAFKDDLEVIQKEPNMNPSRLAVLIESLASGADVFTSSAKPGTDEVNEMEIIVNAAERRENTQSGVDADEDVEMAGEEE